MVELFLGNVKPGNRESLLSKLNRLGHYDSDFSGENGADYLWEGLAEKGYYSNLDFMKANVRDIPDDEECIRSFLDGWLGGDYYYKGYICEFIKDENNHVTAFAVAIES